MKVLIICNNEICYNPRLLKAADYLSARGVEVHVYNPVTGAASEKIYNDVKQSSHWKIIENDISKRSRRSYYKWAYVSVLHKLYTRLWDKFNYKPAFVKYMNKGLILNNINLNIKYNFIMVNLIDNLPYAAKIKRRSGGKIVYDSQEYFVGQYQKYEKEKLDWVTKAEKDFISDVDILITTTNVMRERLFADYKLSIPAFRVRNTPSAKMLASARNEQTQGDALKLVWHGMGIYLNNTRGVHILVQAIGKCKQNVLLTLQGLLPDSQKQILDGYVKTLGIENKIAIVPPADPYDIVGSIRKYDVGLIGELPEEDNQRLTSSNKLFDYLNAGLAVVASDLPGLNETVRDMNLGLTYEPGNIDALAAAIDKLAEDRQLLNELKDRSLKASQQELFWEYDYENVWNAMSNG